MARHRDGRPVRLTTNVTAEAAHRLESIARAQTVTVSWIIARAIDEFLKRADDEQSPELPLRRAPPRNQ
jgi:predicted transcriptional regulator